ncbi:MAG: hypothetical protein EOO43_07795 [Flavobacterium sp.]|nr:MAG: hypothetical protein EOO43_07795 [Flavobacterium sp.]
MSARVNTELKIKMPNDPNARAYIEFYYKGKRTREYTGYSILLNIEPKKEKEPKRRLELLYELKHAIGINLKANNYPAMSPLNEQPESFTMKQALTFALESKLKMKLSLQYKENLSLVCNQFIEFLTEV